MFNMVEFSKELFRQLGYASLADCIVPNRIGAPGFRWERRGTVASKAESQVITCVFLLAHLQADHDVHMDHTGHGIRCHSCEEESERKHESLRS